MSNVVLKRQIEKKLQELSIANQQKALIVLKGIPMDVVDPECASGISLEKIAENKLGYFFQVMTQRKYITYEEFLMLGSFAVEQYETIYVLCNNVYMDQFPLDLHCTEEHKKGLLTHFQDVDDDRKDEQVIGDIDEIISLFVGVREFNGYYIGAYCDEKLPNSTKIVQENLFPEVDKKVIGKDSPGNYIDLIEEADYIALVKTIFSEPDELVVRTTNYLGDINKLRGHLQILAEYWSDWTELYVLQTAEVTPEFEHRDEYNQILKQYWGHESFKTLPFYDVSKLEENKKEVISVSQESIISDLVQQVEKCADENKDYRDVFVTAPTGAGKSVMFQIPAIYLAEKYQLMTIVISPLIALMNDQIKGLERINYGKAKTLNSDISPIIKDEIKQKVAEGEYHILYLSPETLLSRSDIEQLIGDRTIGMIVIDEAHIVTTWGKGFRPDYWYLGDHIRKLRRRQQERKGRSFVVATFTATAIYHGPEDMYTETINSLHMLNPITYLGYVRRNNIDIVIRRMQKEKDKRSEYEPDKFAHIEELVKRAIITNKKTLIYFPTVALIGRCYDYLRYQKITAKVGCYYGPLNRDEKEDSYEKFKSGEKLVMLATKAFGMGIDIPDIAIVAHFAPTGNVCDYVQEIGRAARKPEMKGEAFYQYDTRDFKHINRLHGLSGIQKYQLIEVIRKIDELYSNNLNHGGRGDRTRKRNAMLLDAENFSYIFYSPAGDEDGNINKVKTALLMIQKDFESKIGYSPIAVRPIPLFSVGYFQIEPTTQKRMLRAYRNCLEEIESTQHICRVMLENIWGTDPACMKHSFPQFKYLLYSKNDELEFNQKYTLSPALCVTIDFSADYNSRFEGIWGTLRRFVQKKIVSGGYSSVDEIMETLIKECKVSKYKAQAICEVFLASMETYRRKYSQSTVPLYKTKPETSGSVKYAFENPMNSYFNWGEKLFKKIVRETVNNELYLVNDGSTLTQEYGTVLGILESFDVLTFKMIGGANSQIYIYINQIQTLKNILSYPGLYRNRLLDTVADRHVISVQMLTYLYEKDFTNEQRWDLLEEYFLGSIPDQVKKECLKQRNHIRFE